MPYPSGCPEGEKSYGCAALPISVQKNQLWKQHMSAPPHLTMVKIDFSDWQCSPKTQASSVNPTIIESVCSTLTVLGATFQNVRISMSFILIIYLFNSIYISDIAWTYNQYKILRYAIPTFFFFTVNHWGLVCALHGEHISSQACKFSGAQSQMWLVHPGGQIQTLKQQRVGNEGQKVWNHTDYF